MQLYLQGYTTAEIQKMNPGFKLGIIIHARIEHDWDKHKAEHINVLMSQTRESATKTQLEAIRFASDAMAVHQKILGNAFRKYIQSGQMDDLGDFAKSINIKNYREYVALFMQLTGQENSKKIAGEVSHTHKVEPTATARTIDVESVPGSDLLAMMDPTNGQKSRP